MNIQEKREAVAKTLGQILKESKADMLEGLDKVPAPSEEIKSLVVGVAEQAYEAGFKIGSEAVLTAVRRLSQED